MRRNIRTLHNFEPPASREELPKDREVEAARRRARAGTRFAA